MGGGWARSCLVSITNRAAGNQEVGTVRSRAPLEIGGQKAAASFVASNHDAHDKVEPGPNVLVNLIRWPRGTGVSLYELDLQIAAQPRRLSGATF